MTRSAIRGVPARTVAAAALAVGCGVLAGCTGSDDEAQQFASATPAPVAITGSDDPASETPALQSDVRLGVLVSLTSPPGEGADVRPLAAGVRVAQFRIDLGENEVALDVVDDGGLPGRARAAVEQMVDDGVSGIVVATQGDHLDRAVQDAADASVPVVLAYESADGQPDGVWSLAASTEQATAAVQQALSAQDAEQPFVLDVVGAPVPDIGADRVRAVQPGSERAAAGAVARAARSGEIDAVVAGGDAASLGTLVAALQGRGVEVPLVLSPSARTPAFLDAVYAADGTAAGDYLTWGTDASDTTTLTAGSRADTVAAYFAALRLAVDDASVEPLLGSGDFAQEAGAADTTSHDAVVALVRAAQSAGSVEPSAVRRALAGLSLDAGDGIAGPALDFSRAQALPTGAVVPLAATTQDPGARPVTEETRLYWFTLPGSS